MKTRKLRDIEVSEVGMGCMAFSHGYGAIPDERYSIEAIRSAYDAGCTFFDTGRILENLGAADVELTEEEFAQLEAALDKITVYGHRGFNR